ncbi:MAG: fibronectin type III domain-containing protein, partial [Parcubacteria group bacterium]|nr:fibronectin type III domain-containing protein [Parcubacteria group bacterium]
NLSQARLFGDADGVWVSKTWKLEYKKNSSDAWTTAFSGVNAFANAWSSKSLAVQAQFVRLTVVGVSGGTQAREFELFGTAVSGGGGDTIAPTVSISAPLSGATVSGTIAVTATANDNIGVVGVQFKLDGANLGTEDTTAPYSTSWNTAGVANGSHTLTAVARDAAGNTKVSTAVSVTVNNATTDTTPPSVSITSPTFDVTVSGTITVTATASDNVGVAGVQFKIDGINLGSEDTTSPYSASWNTAAGTNGFHTVAAVARDTAGNVTTSSGVRVTVSNGVSSMTTITLTGTSASRYSKSISSDTLFDATQYTNTSVSISPKNGVAVDITGDTGAQHIIWRGGVIIGSIPTTWTWRQAHDDIGGSGVTIHNNGLAEWQYLRVHNVEDGLKPRENPEYSNGSRFLVRDCYMTAIRDDSIESDRYEPGTVQDCLFDGVFTFISEQNENVGTNDPIGPSEDDTIYIKRVYVRLYPTNAFDGGVEDKYHGGGRWFKWMPRGTTNHKLAVSDSVFAVGAIPRLGWSNLDVPPEVTWVGANNFILWLGTPGAYGGPKPAGVTFLEGQPAKDKWVAVRNKWLTDHGLPAQTFAADYDPFSAPLQQIPISGGGSTDTIAPTVPTGLSATAISSSQINLAWTASTDNVGVTGYKVFRGGVQIATVAGTSYSNTGLSPSTTYTYTVSAYDAAGNNSAQSASKSATTQSGTVTVKAFPTAEGFGAVSIGGRGGKVIEVTNLNDTGTGSLRACVEASGPRTCVFRTGGTITVNSRLNISSPYLTIAGQTAPGGGIALRSDPSNGKGIIQLNSSAHDVIIRYIRVRPGTPSSSTDTGDGITINSDRVILDHVSVSWAIDENVNSWYSTAHDITVQWSILSEGLHCSVHPKGCHSKAAIFGSQEAHSVSMHHTLMAHNDDRHPETKLRTGGVTDLVNNLIYNFGKVAVRISDEYGKSPTNYVGNYVKKGPSSSSSYDIQYYNASGQGTTIYSQGNIGPYRTSTSQPEENVVRPEDRKFIVSARHPAPQVITTSAMEAYNNVLANAGARLPVRDSVDQRIVNDVKNGTGKIINHESEVGGYPTLAAGTPVADSDHDGMSDAWESSHGLSSSDASDGAKTSSNGYTNLENYLNTLAGDI